MRRVESDKERFWRGMIRDHGDGSLSVREFCAIHGVSEQSYYRWKRRLSASTDLTHENTSRKTFAEVRVVTGGVGVSGPTPLDVLFPNGLRLRVARGFDEATLMRLVTLFGSDSC